MLHARQHIADLAEICKAKGIQHVVISPGSRSAPLINAFYSRFGDGCISIVDERSAGFFALGLASFSLRPVVLICTSGTALLNYAPALAESFYQQVPLLVVTADRPAAWIDQQDNQTIRQVDIYHNYVKGQFVLPESIREDDDLWYTHRMINDAINLCTAGNPGPVHLNVPLAEPLYTELPVSSDHIRIINRAAPDVTIKLPAEMLEEWDRARRIMIVHGQDHPGSEVSRLLPAFLKDSRIAILAENISNLADPGIISDSNLLLMHHRDNSPEFPELIIHSGGQVVSKALAGYLRRGKPLACWRIGQDNGIIDTFKIVTRVVPVPPAWVYQALSGLIRPSVKSTFRENWLQADAETRSMANIRIEQAPFSDLTVFHRIMTRIPENVIVVPGNSSIIRYSQLFPVNPGHFYFSNRGVSGIDGCLSTASGIALASGKPTLALLGDLGFLYDSNGLWNRELPGNLRIVVINNGGGGIFHILKGPSDYPGFKKYVEANHPVNIRNFAASFDIDYYFADDDTGIIRQWDAFLKTGKKTALFEIKTDAVVSASAFRQMMRPASGR
jgi:2-succinyl-5-enolpyruvyl-6-hydroxy-3-cyclohexene-1-carboxylate synthase